jgi:hypothetical protein
MSDGEGTLITTEQCLLNPNRNANLDRQQVEERLALFTGSSRMIWLGEGFSDDETDGHVDNIACFAAPGRVIVGYSRGALASRLRPGHRSASPALGSARCAGAETRSGRDRSAAKAAPVDWRGRPLQSSYVNFYLANGGVVMPSFDDPQRRARARRDRGLLSRPRYIAGRCARHRGRRRRHPLHHAAGAPHHEKRHIRRRAIRLLLGQARQYRQGQGDGARGGRERRQRHPDPGIVRDALFLPGPAGRTFRACRAV